MKQVIEQYTSSIIAVIVTFFFLTNQFESVLGAFVENSLTQTAICGNKAFDSYMNLREPEVYLRETYELKANQTISLQKCFGATDFLGEELPVYLVAIEDMSGEVIDVPKTQKKEEIHFPRGGIYQVQVYAIDKNQKEANITVKLLVNEG